MNGRDERRAARDSGSHTPPSMATILIVDDLSANRNFLVTLLRDQGHRVLEASNGREGLAAVQAEHPDLVITDVLMPVMDGYEFVRQLRLDPLTSRIPVVFYTAHYANAKRGPRAVERRGRRPDETRRGREVLKIVNRVLAGESEAELPSRSSALTTEVDQRAPAAAHRQTSRACR